MNGQNGLVVIRTSPLYSTFSPSLSPSMNPTPSPTSASPSINFGLLSSVNSFPFTGTVQLATVPSDVTSIYVYMWGGGGRGEKFGGAGAYVEGTLPVVPGSTLSVIVGGGGTGEGAFGGGGKAYLSWAGGGGRSAIQINGEDIVTAGGGGGGYGGGAATSFNGGQIQSTAFQGSWTNTMSTDCYQSAGGGGGSTTMGGCGGGTKYQGGPAVQSNGGGGGGGYFGGGGGVPGGGGSSYLSRLTTFNLSESGTISSRECNGKYSVYFKYDSCGGGGDWQVTNQNGFVVIRTSPLKSAFSPSAPSTRRPSVTPILITPSAFPSFTPPASNENKLSAGAYAGIIIGCVIFVVSVFVIVANSPKGKGSISDDSEIYQTHDEIPHAAEFDLSHDEIPKANEFDLSHDEIPKAAEFEIPLAVTIKSGAPSLLFASPTYSRPPDVAEIKSDEAEK